MSRCRTVKRRMRPRGSSISATPQALRERERTNALQDHVLLKMASLKGYGCHGGLSLK